MHLPVCGWLRAAPFTVPARTGEQILEPDGDKLPVPVVLVVLCLSSEDAHQVFRAC